MYLYVTCRICLDTVWQQHSEAGRCMTSTKALQFIYWGRDVFEWKMKETNPDLQPNWKNHLCPSKKNTQHPLLNLYMLADGDVYENKLYKHTKMLRESDIRDFQSRSLTVCNGTYMLWTKRTLGCEKMQKRWCHPWWATIFSWRTRWTHQLNIPLIWLSPSYLQQPI